MTCPSPGLSFVHSYILVLTRPYFILEWLISLFNPPPLESLTHVQKTARIFLFTMALVMLCILLSMLAAAGVFVLEHARRMIGSFSELAGDLGIIFVSMMINTICVIVLLEISKADRKLIPPPETPTQPGTDRP